MVRVLEDKREAIAEACARFGVARLDVFGSALRDDFRLGESDVDLLVEFRPISVDLVMSDAIKNRYIAANVERTKQPLYAA
jgi:uncharacterized protein